MEGFVGLCLALQFWEKRREKFPNNSGIYDFLWDGVTEGPTLAQLR